MKIVILTNSEYSHIFGITPFIEKLKGCGHDLVTYVGNNRKEMIVDKQNTIKIYDDLIFQQNFELFFNEYKMYMHLDRNKMLNMNISDFSKIHYQMFEYNLRASETFYTKLIEEIRVEKPDLIIRDTCSLFGRKIADKLHIPAVGYATSMIIPEHLIYNEPRKMINLLFNYKTELFTDKEINNLIKYFYNNTIELCEKYNYRRLPMNHLVDPGELLNFCNGLPFFSGSHSKKYIYCKHPITQKMSQKSNFKNKKKIYMSSGTVVTFPAHVYEKIVNSLKESKYTLSISMKLVDTGIIKFKQIPENVNFKKFSNQSTELEEASLHITHGGYGSMIESIYSNTPMLVIPLQNDQYLDAKIIEKNNLGRVLTTLDLITISEKEIYSIVSDLITNPKYSDGINAYKNKLIRQTDSYDTVIPLLEELVDEKISNY